MLAALSSVKTAVPSVVQQQNRSVPGVLHRFLQSDTNEHQDHLIAQYVTHVCYPGQFNWHRSMLRNTYSITNVSRYYFTVGVPYEL